MSLLRISNLGKHFGGLSAVRDLDLSVEQGEIVGLIGPNGAGKTTVFNLISGYLMPSEGEIFFKDENLVGLRPNRICKKGIGRTFQIVQPFAGLTVLKNVMIGAFNRTDRPDLSEEKSMEVLQFLGLWDKSDFPIGSLTPADRKPLELSKALATEPDFLLLDEVAAGLTPTETEEIIGILRKINQRGVTLLMIEHVMRGVMALSDRIIVLNYGRKIGEGNPREIVKNPLVIEAYLGEELKGDNFEGA